MLTYNMFSAYNSRTESLSSIEIIYIETREECRKICAMVMSKEGQHWAKTASSHTHTYIFFVPRCILGTSGGANKLRWQCIYYVELLHVGALAEYQWLNFCSICSYLWCFHSPFVVILCCLLPLALQVCEQVSLLAVPLLSQSQWISSVEAFVAIVCAQKLWYVFMYWR